MRRPAVLIVAAAALASGGATARAPEAAGAPQKTLFFDWYGIWAGQTAIDDRGEVWVQDAPVGVRLRAQPAHLSERFLKPEKPWERGAANPICVVRDGDLLRLWYDAHGDAPGDVGFVAYAESRDGFAWTRPELGAQAYAGSKANNLLFPSKDFELQSVFLDPSAPPAERFKALGRQSVTYYRGERHVQMSEERTIEILKSMQAAGYTPERRAREFYSVHGIRGAVSADGLRWTFGREPLLDVGRTALDSQNIAAYDPDSGKYVGYLRGHQDRRRIVRRTEGSAFRDWSPTRPVFQLDAQDPIDDDIYTSCYTRYPGTGWHLMFPAIYHRLTSVIDVQLATSRDGLLWSRPERTPVIARRTGESEYGMIFAMPNLVAFGAERIGVMCYGSFENHDWGKRYRDGRKLEWRWATWKPDRLVALEAPAEGRVTLVERPVRAGELRLNYEAQKEGGWVKVELVEPPTSPASRVKAIDGFGLDAAETLTGDELARVVRWKGKSDLGALRGRRVALRIHLARARLYSVTY